MADDLQRPVADMPFYVQPEIAAAIVKVMAAVGTLGKGNKNTFDKYDFASIDDFIKHVRAHCAEAGLFFIPQESGEPKLIEMKKKDGSPLMMWWQRFGFFIVHASGQVVGPVYKTVKVQAGGAQAAGSAQSYALKQLMRALFLIPTGDKDDPDTKGTAELTAPSTAPTDMQKEAERIRGLLKRAKSSENLLEAWNSNAVRLEEIRDASEQAYKFLRDMFETRKKELS